ncbi:MAG: DUF5681 domain-containing protein [Stellaceae bacterium]|jgi:uncharacterized protein DUF5681
MAANTAGIQRGRPFRRGQSGNPGGKPKGARHRTTVAAELLMQEDAEAVVRAVLAAAKDGDMTAARLVLDRIAPPRKGRPVRFAIPEMTSARDIGAAVGAVALAMGRGELTPEEAASVAAVLEIRRKALETVEIENRVAALEQQTAEKK